MKINFDNPLPHDTMEKKRNPSIVSSIPRYSDVFALDSFNQNNIRLMLDTARRFSVRPLFLCSPTEFHVYKRNFLSSQNINNDSSFLYGIIIRKPYRCMDIQKAQNLSSIIFVEADDNLRVTLEQTKGITFFGMEHNQVIDGMHARYSGLDHVMVAIASKRNHSFCTSFFDVLQLSKSKQAIFLGRVKQNIMLCQKKKVSYTVFSFAKSVAMIKKELLSIHNIISSK